MIRITAIAAALLCLLTVNAEARQRHRSASAVHPLCNVAFPCDLSYGAPKAVREASRVARGRYVARQIGIGGVAPNGRHLAVSNRRRGGVRFERNISNGADRLIKSTAPSLARQRAPARQYQDIAGKPTRFIAGRLVCARNVDSALAERGIKGTGSALALSYLKWGRSAGGPVPGAVIVSGRRGGGHVAIVSRVQNGVVYAWNATGGRHGWREVAYRHRVIDYRVPG